MAGAMRKMAVYLGLVEDEDVARSQKLRQVLEVQVPRDSRFQRHQAARVPARRRLLRDQVLGQLVREIRERVPLSDWRRQSAFPRERR